MDETNTQYEAPVIEDVAVGDGPASVQAGTQPVTPIP